MKVHCKLEQYALHRAAYMPQPPFSRAGASARAESARSVFRTRSLATLGAWFTGLLHPRDLPTCQTRYHPRLIVDIQIRRLHQILSRTDIGPKLHEYRPSSIAQSAQKNARSMLSSSRRNLRTDQGSSGRETRAGAYLLSIRPIRYFPRHHINASCITVHWFHSRSVEVHCPRSRSQVAYKLAR